MGRCAQSALRATFLLVSSGFISGTLAAVTPFLEPGFFFDYNTPGQPVPIPVTSQCESIHVEWSRSTATGPNPTAPYTLQVFASTFVVPFTIDAGSDLSFDWEVPFAPGTQYQICMYDKNGVTGGCQAMYTVIQNTTVTNPTCQNVTFPAAAMEVVGVVNTGPMSQYGFVDSCSDISITPQNGKPPYVLTVAPSLHPPYNLTSYTMDPINWTVSLSWASPFFLSLTDSEGNIWANGPMHSGKGLTACLNTDPRPPDHSKIVAAGAGIGGAVCGIVLAAVAAYFFFRRQDRLRHLEPMAYGMAGEEKGIKFFTGTASSESPVDAGYQSDRMVRHASFPSPPGLSPPNTAIAVRSSSLVSSVGPRRQDSNDSSMHKSQPPISTGMVITNEPSDFAEPQDQRESTSSRRAGARSNVYIMHHDAGRAPVTVYTLPNSDVVELPPIYFNDEPSGSGESSRNRRQHSADEKRG